MTRTFEASSKNQAEFNYLESYGNTLGLLKSIEKEGYRIWIAEYAPVAYHQAQVKF